MRSEKFDELRIPVFNSVAISTLLDVKIFIVVLYVHLQN